MDGFGDLLPANPVLASRSATMQGAAARPTMAWHIDAATGRPLARWVLLAADGSDHSVLKGLAASSGFASGTALRRP